MDQTFTDYELLICDDHSRDNTPAVIAGFADPRLRSYRNPANLGLVGNWNRCIELATGRYICIFHADDQMLPGNLAAKVRLLEEHPQVGLVHSNIHMIDTTGRIIGGHWASLPAYDSVEAGRSCFERLILQGNYICCPTVMVRAECYRRLGHFSPKLHHTADMEMWMRIALNFDVAYAAEPSLRYRVHSQQDNKGFVGSGREIVEVWHAIRLVFSENGVRIQDAPALLRRGLRFLSHWAFAEARSRTRQRRFTRGFEYAVLAARFFLQAYSPLNPVR